MVKTEWMESLRKYEHIMIFGARDRARDLYEELKMRQRDILCFVVSERRDNPVCLSGKPVKTFSEISPGLKKRALVIVSGSYGNQDRMEALLSQAGFCHITASPWQSVLSMENLGRDCCGVLGERRRSVAEFLCQDRARAERGARIRIYAVTSTGNLHKANRSCTSEYVKYIQAGAAAADCRICDITDDTGDHISRLNPYFCELTAGYWIYKNDKEHDYVGLYHYSRCLDLSDDAARKIAESEIDAVLPVPHIFRHEMAAIISPQEAEVLWEAIRRASPEYLASAERYFSNNVFIAANIMFARKELYCRYYEWLFRVLEECVRIKAGQGAKLARRIFGYYGENLLTIFFIQNSARYEVLYSEAVQLF